MDGLSSAILKRPKSRWRHKSRRADTSTGDGGALHGGIMPALADARAYYRPDQYDELPLDMMRGAIATRLTQSMQQVPHFYLTRTLY